MPKRSAKLPIASAGAVTKFEPSEKDWRRIEKAYGPSFSGEVQAAVQSITQTFLDAVAFEEAAPETAQAELKIRSVKAALSKLRQAIVENGPNVSPLASFKGKQMISEQAGLPFLEGSDGLTKFAWTTVLKIEHACNAALEDLAEQREAGGSYRQGAAWQAWVCSLARALEKHGYPIGVRKDANKRRSDSPSAFVSFIAELQKCVPGHLRRSTHSSDALSKAIYEARKAEIAPPLDQA